MPGVSEQLPVAVVHEVAVAARQQVTKALGVARVLQRARQGARRQHTVEAAAVVRLPQRVTARAQLVEHLVPRHAVPGGRGVDLRVREGRELGGAVGRISKAVRAVPTGVSDQRRAVPVSVLRQVALAVVHHRRGVVPVQAVLEFKGEDVEAGGQARDVAPPVAVRQQRHRLHARDLVRVPKHHQVPRARPGVPQPRVRAVLALKALPVPRVIPERRVAAEAEQPARVGPVLAIGRPDRRRRHVVVHDALLDVRPPARRRGVREPRGLGLPAEGRVRLHDDVGGQPVGTRELGKSHVDEVELLAHHERHVRRARALRAERKPRRGA
mmetsp:Transcript_11268/g.39257  ORF Transcript_11268/g.39257 Transcript_11268/m.39257 type:complete len:326 (+) Transcript_11268:86-1063(+)